MTTGSLAGSGARILVVISHYDARPSGPLVRLLDEMSRIPAGCPHDLRIVVNQAQPKRLELPSRHDAVRILYRENAGFNIGAWDLGWRSDPAYERYLFVQDECRIRGPGWLGNLLRRLDSPRVGLVGECAFGSSRPITWRAQAAEFAHDHPDEPNFFVFAQAWMRDRGIDPGTHVDHLQSLVLATRRDVLEAIDGFRIGRDKEEAIAAEIAISRAVVALGLRCVQASFFPFRYIVHPQWSGKAEYARTRRGTLERLLARLEARLVRLGSTFTPG